MSIHHAKEKRSKDEEQSLDTRKNAAHHPRCSARGCRRGRSLYNTSSCLPARNERARKQVGHCSRYLSPPELKRDILAALLSRIQPLAISYTATHMKRRTMWRALVPFARDFLHHEKKIVLRINAPATVDKQAYPNTRKCGWCMNARESKQHVMRNLARPHTREELQNFRPR